MPIFAWSAPGLAGLTVALEAARLGASVAVLEGRHVGWNASGHQLGTVMPGYGLPIGDLIARIGFEDARELWSLSKQGAELVRANAAEELMPGIALERGRAGGFQRRCRRSIDQPAADAGRGFRDRSGGLAGRSRARPNSRPGVISTACIIRRRFRSTAANMSMAWPRWRGGQGRGSSRTRRSSASIHRAFASAS